jgi:orotate phosphoribosyltransferase
MEPYQIRFAKTLAETGALFFDEGLVLKDGRPTPYFVNMARFQTGRLSLELGSYFADMMAHQEIVGQTDVIIGPSYKGSAIALATVIALWQNHGVDLPFDYDRKEAKTHGESSGSGSFLVNRVLFDGCRIFLVDDVATSMATKYELLEKILAEGADRSETYRFSGLGIGVDRQQTTAVYDADGRVVPDRKGADALRAFVEKTGVPVFCVAGIQGIVETLYRERVPVRIGATRRAIDEESMTAFREYMERYGIEARLK